MSLPVIAATHGERGANAAVRTWGACVVPCVVPVWCLWGAFGVPVWCLWSSREKFVPGESTCAAGRRWRRKRTRETNRDEARVFTPQPHLTKATKSASWYM